MAKKKREPYKGQDFSKEEILTQPNQAMSLHEIIERFTRGEAVPIGQMVNFYESEEDLEKLDQMDIIDKRDYVERLQTVLDEYDKQQKEEREAVAEAEREKWFREKLEAQQKAENPKDSADSKVTP